MNLFATLIELGAGLRPDQLFDSKLSVDVSELLLVFGTIAISMIVMVIFGNWWSR